MTIEELKKPERIDEDRIEILKELFPEAFGDGKLNIDILKEEIEGLDTNLIEEKPEEFYGLQWVGKKEARKLAFQSPKGTLNFVENDGVNSETTKNIFIEGDNLEVLRILQKSYSGKIKLIYIDPPYNTGNDFVYNDDFKEPVEKYLQRTSQADEEGLLISNPRSSGRFHANWLSMMLPRLKLARTFLREDGVIFISIDDNEVANLRLLLDEIFGEGNFIGTIAIQSNPRGRHLEKHIATSHETIVIYAKNFDEAIINKSPLTEEQKKEYNHSDENGHYRLLGLRKRGAFSKREERPNLHYPIYYSERKDELSLEKEQDSVEIIPRLSDGTEGVWRWGKEKFLTDKNLLIARKVSGRDEWDVFQKDYLDESSARKYKTLWFDKDVNYENGKRELRELFDGDAPFDTPKPLNLIKRILQMGMGKNDIVMDFFAGSGTTAQAVLELNKDDGGKRQFILIQIPEPIENSSYKTLSEISKERIKRSIKKINDNVEVEDLDTGFKVFSLNKSNIRKWELNKSNSVDSLNNQIDLFTTSPFIEQAKEIDIVIELMVYQGFPLDSNIINDSRKRNILWIVQHNDVPFTLVICLDEKLNPETAELLTSTYNKGTFICLDNALSNEQKILLSESMNVKTI